jgi:hypothetical protein
MEKIGVLRLSYQFTRGSATPSVSYVQEHYTYPAMVLSTQQVSLHSLLYILLLPDGNIFQSQTTRD